MRGISLILLGTLAWLPSFAQEPASTPVRVCVAQLRNQTPTQFDVVKLRQQLMDGLKQSKLTNAASLTVIPIEVAESEDALAAIQAQSCQFTVYMRLLQQAAADRSNVDVSGGITYRSGPQEKLQFLMGVQCTVERTGSTIPALIDRQYTKTPVLPQSGIDKILAAEVQRIAGAIDKKLAPTPK